MFGLFKKKVTPDEFGIGVVHLANGWFVADSGRSLGTLFEDWDGSRGWVSFLERKGIPVLTQSLYHRLFAHCAIQAACSDFDKSKVRAITRAAMVESFPDIPNGYDFERTYASLEAAYVGQHNFCEKIEALCNEDFKFDYLPNPTVGILNAKYLIEKFIIPNMNIGDAFIDGFYLYSGTVCQGIVIARRAMVELSKSIKI